MCDEYSYQEGYGDLRAPDRCKTCCETMLLTGMAVAATTGAQFIRVNVLSGAMVTDQGIIEGVAHELLLYRKHLNAQKKCSNSR